MRFLTHFINRQLIRYFTYRIPTTVYDSLSKEGIFKGHPSEPGIFESEILPYVLIGCSSVSFVLTPWVKSQMVYAQLPYLSFLTVYLSLVSFLFLACVCLLMRTCGSFSPQVHKIMHFLHLHLPHKINREIEVMNAVLEAHNDSLTNLTAPLFYYHEYQNLGAKPFCEKYFNKHSSGLVDFINERLALDPLFLNYALSIPRRQELSIDSLRKILSAYTGEFKLDSPLKIDGVFKNYTPKQIETLFTNPGSREVLYDFADDPYTPIPVVNSFDKLQSKYLPAIYNRLDNVQIQDFHFLILKTPVEYTHAGAEFNNCIGSRFHRNSTIIIATHPNGYKTAMEFEHGKLTQMSGPGKQVSLHRRELVGILKKNDFKIKFDRPHLRE